MKHPFPSYQYLLLNDAALPNPVLVSRQIDGIKEALQRIKSSQEEDIQLAMIKKLEQLTRQS